MTRRACAGRPVELGILGDLIGFRLAQAQHRATRRFEAAVGKPLALRKVEFSLLALLRANGPLTPKQLAQTLWLSAPALTAVLDRLQARGLLQRRPHPEDGRSQQVLPTEAGSALSAQAEVAAAGMEAPLSQRLSPAQRAMLMELLQKLAD
jgi:DNA-binding MarR family transcriptional regulator